MHDTTKPTLEALIQACAAGDRLAFKALYDATNAKLYGGVYRLLRDHSLAQDGLQEGYLKIWRNAGQFDHTKGSAMAWMSIIVRRTALDKMAKQRPTESLDNVELSAPHIEPSDPGLARCLEKLADMHRKVLMLSYVYGYNHEEIAVMVDKPVGTVKSWIRRASVQLRECLEP